MTKCDRSTHNKTQNQLEYKPKPKTKCNDGNYLVTGATEEEFKQQG